MYESLPILAEAAPAWVVDDAQAVFTEGPAIDASGNVFFSDIENDRILKLSAGGERSVFRQPAGRTNGNTFDRTGRLLHCEGAEFGPGGGRRITRTDLATGRVEILTDRFDGLRYNSPNDLCVDRRGRIYFTDPRYGDRSGMEMAIEGVYRIDADGLVTRVLGQPEVERPNGLAVDAHGARLYVVDSSPRVGGNRKLWAFELDDAGDPHEQQLVHDFAPGRGGDGMRLDIEGNLWVAAGVLSPRRDGETALVPPGIYQLSPAGRLLGRIPIPQDLVTNLAFGGPEGCTLFITAGNTLFTATAPLPGQRL